MSILKGTGNVLKTILGSAMQKHPIGTPVALGATAAAGLGVLGNEDSGWVGRNTKNSDDAFGEELKKWENKHISAYAQSKINKLQKDILELTMENAELKDMVLDLGGEYK